jgi:hypothetical protein
MENVLIKNLLLQMGNNTWFQYLPEISIDVLFLFCNCITNILCIFICLKQSNVLKNSLFQNQLAVTCLQMIKLLFLT